LEVVVETELDPASKKTWVLQLNEWQEEKQRNENRKKVIQNKIQDFKNIFVSKIKIQL
jgi:hypothetical protein